MRRMRDTEPVRASDPYRRCLPCCAATATAQGWRTACRRTGLRPCRGPAPDRAVGTHVPQIPGRWRVRSCGVARARTAPLHPGAAHAWSLACISAIHFSGWNAMPRIARAVCLWLVSDDYLISNPMQLPVEHRRAAWADVRPGSAARCEAYGCMPAVLGIGIDGAAGLGFRPKSGRSQPTRRIRYSCTIRQPATVPPTTRAASSPPPSFMGMSQ